MENSAGNTVIRGTLITCKRNPHYGVLATAAAVNSGVTAVTFFSLREFAISPLLVHTLSWPQYVRRRRELGINDPSDPSLDPPTWSDLRKHKTLDTGISGALAGGALRGWKSGPRAILPGALTIGALCTLLQLAYNEAGIMRLRYVSGLNVSTPVTPPPPSKSLSERFLTMFGVQQVTDEQYVEKLKATREAHLKRIAELEQQLAREKADRDVEKDSQ
ncbi:hypothetical protein D9615_001564 [Tricholomella constricta]|uniref:Uncharacterized protein n=1 Tax=Tricholomella constricta TaxID=117010 RepID=A0A8H5MAF4_9AGAR|nr:hypothetical protein D9615_001564 [Tricholomella constricta]